MVLSSSQENLLRSVVNNVVAHFYLHCPLGREKGVRNWNWPLTGMKPRLTATSIKYGLLAITATLFWPPGKMTIHFHVKKKKPVNTVIR